MDSHTEVKHLFNKLDSWREVSQRAQRDFSNIISSHRGNISNGINNLVEEVSDLKSKLLVLTEERNVLLERVDSLTSENQQLLLLLQEPKGYYEEDTLKVEVQDNVGEYNMNSDIGKNEELKDYDYIKASSLQHENRNPSQDKNPLELDEDNEMTETDVGNNDKEILSNNDAAVTDEEKSPDIVSALSGCGKGFPQKKSLDKHIEGIHDKVRKHVCQDCGFTTSKKNLNVHIKGVHDKIKDHVCTECGYATSIKRNLKRHKETVHEKIKNLKCGECDFAAYQKCDLKTHIAAVHEKIRKHDCKACTYSATQKWYLKKHLATVHKIRNVRE